MVDNYIIKKKSKINNVVKDKERMIRATLFGFYRHSGGYMHGGTVITPLQYLLLLSHIITTSNL